MSDTKLAQIISQESRKKITFPFHHAKIDFYLSFGLFSSHEIDRGSRMLLKSLKEKHYDSDSILDIGCGVGSLFITLAKTLYPKANFCVQDRDHLALSFSAYNAHINNIDTLVKYKHQVLIEKKPVETFDLVVSNLPAKAGSKVLENFFCTAPFLLNKNGILAIVIVKSLVEMFERILGQTSLDVIYRLETTQYLVAHLRVKTETSEKLESVDFSWDQFYIRSEQQHFLPSPNIAYTLDTSYGLPNFDVISYQDSLTFQIFDNLTVSGKTLFIHPGQFHLPAYLLTENPKLASDGLSFASNDKLQLLVAEKHCKIRNIESNYYSISNLGDLEVEEEEYQNVFLYLSPTPQTNWEKMVIDALFRITKKNSSWVIMGKSHSLQKLVPHISHCEKVVDQRKNGYRTVIFCRNHD